MRETKLEKEKTIKDTGETTEVENTHAFSVKYVATYHEVAVPPGGRNFNYCYFCSIDTKPSFILNIPEKIANLYYQFLRIFELSIFGSI